jgi:hypothetical protein
MFKNKHVVIAMIVAPILAVTAYFAVDYVVQEKPTVAQAGKSYSLVAKSNCRYASGECIFMNSGFSANLTVEKTDGLAKLVLNSSHPLEGVKVGFAQEGEDIQQAEPHTMQLNSETRQEWNLPVDFLIDETTTLAIAMTANGSHYFGQTIMAFTEYKTIFKEDFRRK